MHNEVFFGEMACISRLLPDNRAGAVSAVRGPAMAGSSPKPFHPSFTPLLPVPVH